MITTLALRKGFGINRINLAAMSCVCMLIHCASPLEKHSLNTPIIHSTKSKFFVRKRSPKLERIQITVVLNLSQREEKLILITAGPSVSSSPLYACLSFFSWLLAYHCKDCWSHPIGGLPTCSWGHGWLKPWQVDSTLKPSIDPWEQNETANPLSLSTWTLCGTEGKDTQRVRGHAPPLDCCHTPKISAEKQWKIQREVFLTLLYGYHEHAFGFKTTFQRNCKTQTQLNADLKFCYQKKCLQQNTGTLSNVTSNLFNGRNADDRQLQIQR